MRQRTINILFSLFVGAILLVPPGVSLAQGQPGEIEENQFDQEQWEDLSKELDYENWVTPGNAEPGEGPMEAGGGGGDGDGEMDPEPREASPPPKPRPKPVSLAMPAWVAWIFKAIFIILIVGLLVYIILKLVGSGALKKRPKKTTDAEVTLENLEEYIHESDLERFLRLSLEKGDYRMAIRVYYLMIIKELSERNFIRWKKDKSNHHYVSELNGKEEYQPFREATLSFERVWYGDMDVSESAFHKLSPSFKSLIDRIKRKEAEE